MRKLLSFALCCGIAACAKKPEVRKPAAGETTQLQIQTERCQKVRAYVKTILLDTERPWPTDLSYIADEMLIECSNIESEVIDALRALLQRKTQHIIHDEQVAPAPMQESPLIPKPSVTCIEALQNLPMVCDIPLFTKELIERCGMQTRRGVGKLAILDTIVPTVADLREPTYNISCRSRWDDKLQMNTHTITIEQQRFLGHGMGWRYVEGWMFHHPPLQYEFDGAIKIVQPSKQTNYRLNEQCRYEYDSDYLPQKCTVENTERLAAALCP